VTYAPAVAPPITRADQRIYDVHIESIEGVCPIDEENGIITEMWGFRIAGDDEVVCGSPGPILRGRVGDVVNITLTNMEGNTHPHNIDFHAVTGQGGGQLISSPTPESRRRFKFGSSTQALSCTTAPSATCRAI